MTTNRTDAEKDKWTGWEYWDNVHKTLVEYALRKYVEEQNDIDCLVDPPTGSLVNTFSWDALDIVRDTPKGRISVMVNRHYPFEDGEASYQRTIGVSELDKDNWANWVFDVRFQFDHKKDGITTSGGNGAVYVALSADTVHDLVSSLASKMIDQAKRLASGLYGD